MTATDELRRMLDERGVEYTDRDMFGKHVLHWGAPMVNGAMFTDAGEWTELVVENATPEQAIEATLGETPTPPPPTPPEQPPYDVLIDLLRDEWDIDVMWDGLRRFWYVGLTDEGVRKRDEREAMLRRGTCHNAAPTYLDFLCSECGFVHYHSDANDAGDGNGWRYCPNCGAKVVDDASVD